MDDQSPAPQPAPPPQRQSRGLTILVLVLALAVVGLGGVIAYPYIMEMTSGSEPAPETPTAAKPVTPATQNRPAPKPGDCRSFEKTVQIAGQTQTVTGRACMQKDGSWKVVE